jgi:hypothetical protein
MSVPNDELLAAVGSSAEQNSPVNADTTERRMPTPAQNSNSTQPPQATPWTCSLDLISTPPPETVWLLNGVLPAGAVVLFSGREGTMKTWLALDWARAVAEGATWLGRQCETGAVLYLDAEMPGDLFRSWLYAVGGSRNLNVWRWQDAGFPRRVDSPGLFSAAQCHRLIVVDTLRRFMDGLEENSATEMAEITDALRQLTRWGATILVLHHGPKDPERSGYRGSTELGAGVDIALTVEKQTSPGVVSLSLTESKTRYVPVSLRIRVERTPSRPVFHDAEVQAQAAASAALAGDLQSVAVVITDLQDRLGRHPNQSDVIQEARQRNLGSRGTLLRWLAQGEGTRWQSELDGRSRVYTLLSVCPRVPAPGGPDGLDNTTVAAGNLTEPVQLSTCSGGIGENTLDSFIVSTTLLNEVLTVPTDAETGHRGDMQGSADLGVEDSASAT